MATAGSDSVGLGVTLCCRMGSDSNMTKDISPEKSVGGIRVSVVSLEMTVSRRNKIFKLNDKTVQTSLQLGDLHSTHYFLS